MRYIKLYTIEHILAGCTLPVLPRDWVEIPESCILSHFNAGNHVSLFSIVHVCLYGIV